MKNPLLNGLVAVALLGAFLTTASGLEAQSLFSYAKTPNAFDAEIQVAPNLELLREVPAQLAITLPSGESLIYGRDYLEQRHSGMMWLGSTSSGDQIVLTFEQGKTFATIETPEGRYQLAPAGLEGHLLKTPRAELDVETYCTTDHESLPLDLAPPEPTVIDEAAPLDPQKMSPQIDVLVVYTPLARQTYGVSGMVGWARSSIDTTNAAFITSQMSVRLRLVGVREVAFQENGSTGAAVSWMFSSPQVRSLRNQVGADIVGMLTLNGSACGTAATIPSGNLQQFSEYMFQATRIACIANHTFSHEIGHLIGMEHDPVNGRPVNFASFPWSYGHFVDGHFRTIMSYRTECAQGCTRRPYFSSPTLSFQGVPTGIAGERDNRRTGNAITPTIANYRQPVAGEPPAAPTGLTAEAPSAFRVNLSWTDRSNNENQFEIERADTGSFVRIATIPGGSTTFTDETVEPQTSYRYRVRASNAFGASAYTSTAQVETPAPDLSSCASDDQVVCLLGGRFEVRVSWRDFDDNTGVGRVVGGSSDQSAIFWFFSPDNWEMMVKVLDACSFNERFWVFSAATTNVEYTLDVRDTETGQTKTYTNELGTSAPAVTDTDALATCM